MGGIHGDKYEAILDAAYTVFGTKGFYESKISVNTMWIRRLDLRLTCLCTAVRPGAGYADRDIVKPETVLTSFRLRFF